MKVKRHIHFQIINKQLVTSITMKSHINIIHQAYKHNQAMYTDSPFSYIHNIHEISPMHIIINSHSQV